MAADMVTVQCKVCGEPISTRTRGNTVRCPGCKTGNWVPKDAAPTVLDEDQDDAGGRAGGLLTYPARWDPAPVEPDALDDARADCPDCGEPLTWEPAGTLLYCPGCEEPMFPPSLIPQEGGRDDDRRVSTQAERDDEALRLAERRAVVIDRVRQVLDDDRLAPQTRGRLEWYVTEIGAARTMARVAELAERLAGERIQRRGWFRADALNPMDIDQDDDQDDEDEYAGDDDDYGEDHGEISAPPVLAVAAGPPPPAAMQTRQAFDVRNYRVDDDAPPNHCQVKARTHYSGDPNHYPCGAAGRFAYAGVRVCEGHYRALTTSAPGR
jgi:uncharacterized Zn finger protein (UPF0148 family)